MRAGRGVRGGGADVAAHQFRRHHDAGPALDGLAFQGVVAVRGPDPVGALQDAQVHAGAAGGAALNLDAGMGLAEFVKEAVGGEGLFVDGGAAGVAVFGQVPVLVPFEVADVVFAQQGIQAVVDVLPGRRVDEVEDVLVPPFEWQPAAVLVARADGPTIHSGWARATSESRLTISGSTQRPNSMPRPVTASISGVRPSGHRPRRRTSRPGRRGRRGGRGTSRRRGRSAPRRAPRRIRRVRAGWPGCGRSRPLPRR